MTISYAMVCAVLAKLNIDLEWADDHYLTTLFDIIGESVKEKPHKETVGSAGISKYIKES